MINYYITHSFCGGEDFLDTEVDISKLHDNLLQYFLILNVTNFYPSSLGKKGGFFRVGVRVRIIDAIEHSS